MDKILKTKQIIRTLLQVRECSDYFHVVEMTGFEPAASASRTQRSTKLSHISIKYSRLAIKYLIPHLDKIFKACNQIFNTAFRCKIFSKPIYFIMMRLVCQVLFSKKPLKNKKSGFFVFEVLRAVWFYAILIPSVKFLKHLGSCDCRGRLF